MSLRVEQYVPRLDVAVNLASHVEVLQSPEGLVQDNGDLLFSQLQGGAKHEYMYMSVCMYVCIDTFQSQHTMTTYYNGASAGITSTAFRTPQ